MMDLQIEGAERFQQLATALRKVGDRELKRELMAGLQRGTKSTRARIKASLGSTLPSRGGLADVMARSRISTRSRAGGRNPGVRIEAKAPHDLRGMDKGRLRHPVFGNKSAWKSQRIESGVFSDPIREDLPQIRDELYRAMVRVAEQFLNRH